MVMVSGWGRRQGRCRGELWCPPTRNYIMGHIIFMLVPMVVPTAMVAKVLVFDCREICMESCLFP